jgi:glycosyltransferase involved in cell wall biosynthesis
MKKASGNSPLVTAIVPVFNGEKYLRASLDSIVNQTYPHVEILVMDDASTDATSEIIASYGARVRHVRQESNQGIYGNANDGITLAKGKYIAVYHADDIYDARIVEREVEFLEKHPDVGAVFCKDIFVDGEDREYGRLELPREVKGSRPLSFATVFNALLENKNRMFVCPTAMVRSSVYRDLGTYRQDAFLNSSDLEMWLRIAQKYPLAILDEYLIRYRHFEGQSSRRYHKLRTEPERYFTIMDLYLVSDSETIATPKALAAYEGHRTEDLLIITVNNYILDQLEKAQISLSKVRLLTILKGSGIDRGRLLILFLMLQILLRLPRLTFMANLFREHWYGKKRQNGTINWFAPFFKVEQLLRNQDTKS